MPPLADFVSESDVKFTVTVDDFMKAEQVVVEIEADKTAVGVSTLFGSVILVSNGDNVKAGQELFVVKKAMPAAVPTPPPVAKPAVGAPLPQRPAAPAAQILVARTRPRNRAV